MPVLSVSTAQHLCSVSYEEEMAFVAVLGDLESEQVVGSACYYVNPTTNLADVAYMIHPDWQGYGLATALQTRMIEYARSKGLRGFTADVLWENRAMIAVMHRSGAEVTTKSDYGTIQVQMLFR